MNKHEILQAPLITDAESPFYSDDPEGQQELENYRRSRNALANGGKNLRSGKTGRFTAEESAQNRDNRLAEESLEVSSRNDIDIRSLAHEAKKARELGDRTTLLNIEDEIQERLIKQAEQNGWNNEQADDALQYFINIIYADDRSANSISEVSTTSVDVSDAQPRVPVDIENVTKEVRKVIAEGDRSSLEEVLGDLTELIESSSERNGWTSETDELEELRVDIFDTLDMLEDAEGMTEQTDTQASVSDDVESGANADSEADAILKNFVAEWPDSDDEPKNAVTAPEDWLKEWRERYNSRPNPGLDDVSPFDLLEPAPSSKVGDSSPIIAIDDYEGVRDFTETWPKDFNLTRHNLLRNQTYRPLVLDQKKDSLREKITKGRLKVGAAVLGLLLVVAADAYSDHKNNDAASSDPNAQATLSLEGTPVLPTDVAFEIASTPNVITPAAEPTIESNSTEVLPAATEPTSTPPAYEAEATPDDGSVTSDITTEGNSSSEGADETVSPDTDGVDDDAIIGPPDSGTEGHKGPGKTNPDHEKADLDDAIVENNYGFTDVLMQYRPDLDAGQADQLYDHLKETIEGKIFIGVETYPMPDENDDDGEEPDQGFATTGIVEPASQAVLDVIMSWTPEQ